MAAKTHYGPYARAYDVIWKNAPPRATRHPSHSGAAPVTIARDKRNHTDNSGSTPRPEDQMDLIEALLFALLGQSLPAEAKPFAVGRLARTLPNWSETDIANRSGWRS